MKNKEFKVFSITNKSDNNKRYIGKTSKTIEERVKKLKNSDKNSKIGIALNSFIDSCFEIECLSVLYGERQATAKVYEYIDMYNTVETGYNGVNFKNSTSTKADTNVLLSFSCDKDTAKGIDTLATMFGTSRSKLLYEWSKERLKEYSSML